MMFDDAPANDEVAEHRRAAMSRTVLDPTSEYEPEDRPLTARPASLLGKTVGLLDISKERGDIFLDRIDELLQARGVSVLRFRKPTVAKPASVDLRQEIVDTCHLVIETLAD
jgi:hypothetical protein